MKVNLDDFLKDEIKIENFRYVKGFLLKKDRVNSICFERVSIETLLLFARDYFGLGKKTETEEIEINFVKLCEDLYRVFRQDPRNHWLKLKYLKQQSQESVMLMAGIVISELLGKKKTEKQQDPRKSPLGRFLETL